MILLRPAVAWFAEQIELALRRNDHKPAWETYPDDALLDKAHEELQELAHAVFGGDDHDVVSEAADLAACALFLADLRRAQITASPPTDPYRHQVHVVLAAARAFAHGGPSIPLYFEARTLVAMERARTADEPRDPK